MKKVALSLVALAMISAGGNAAAKPKNGIPPGMSATGGLPPGFVHALEIHTGNLPPGLLRALQNQLAHCERRTGQPCTSPVSP